MVGKNIMVHINTPWNCPFCVISWQNTVWYFVEPISTPQNADVVVFSDWDKFMFFKSLRTIYNNCCSARTTYSKGYGAIPNSKTLKDLSHNTTRVILRCPKIRTCFIADVNFTPNNNKPNNIITLMSSRLSQCTLTLYLSLPLPYSQPFPSSNSCQPKLIITAIICPDKISP